MKKLALLMVMGAVAALLVAGCQEAAPPAPDGSGDLSQIAATQQDPAAIGNFVWNDTDMDGIQDEGEPGIEGVLVELFNCENQLLDTTVTDTGGFYGFENLAAGQYYLRFALPMGFAFSPDNEGDIDSTDSDPEEETGRTECTELGADEIDLTWDAGMFTAEEGCTFSKGYWKNHAGQGNGNQPDVVTPLLPIWLGNENGDESIEVTTAEIAYDLLGQRTYGEPSDGITKLYAQLLAAKLNIADGASDDDVADVISDADDFLADHSYTEWSDLDHDQRQMVLGWKDTLDMYNNGFIGPGPCDDENDSAAW